MQTEAKNKEQEKLCHCSKRPQALAFCRAYSLQNHRRMGIVRTCDDENQRILMEMEEFKGVLLSCAGINRRKSGGEEEEEVDLRRSGGASTEEQDEDYDRNMVCVTSGASFLGLAIVNHLLSRGYSVRLIVHNEEEEGRVREMRRSTNENSRIWVVTAKLSEVESLMEAFEGCGGVFHTSAFTDPSGLSGYTKFMAEIEEKASQNVMEACARTPSVRNCVLTSSLLSCVWPNYHSLGDLPPVINHESWSDESLCIDKQLWCALGKLRAEKAAWRVAKESGLNLTTICPGLITGREFSCRNPTGTIAYLKGAQEMYESGLLAVVDVTRLAEAHVRVLEAMNKTACGRYICFDHVITGEEEAEELTRAIGFPRNKIVGDSSGLLPTKFELSNKKLSSLMLRTARCGYNRKFAA